jgi:hypothetical protein
MFSLQKEGFCEIKKKKGFPLLPFQYEVGYVECLKDFQRQIDGNVGFRDCQNQLQNVHNVFRCDQPYYQLF